MATPSALFLAAGKSTRIHPVTKGKPKPLLEIEGDPIIARNLRWLAAEGLRELYVNLHYEPDQIRGFVGDGSAFGVQVTYSEEPDILGTAGAVKNLEASFAKGPFMVIYGDNLMSFDLEALRKTHADSGATVTIALFDRNRHPHTGIAGGRVQMQGDGRITAFIEGATDDVSSLVNAGVYICEPEVLDHIPPATFYDFGKEVFPALLEAGRPLQGHLISDYCLGIDTPQTYETALELIRSGQVSLR